MTLFNSDPYKITDVSTLQDMVDLLQKANNNLTQIQSIQRDLHDTLYHANLRQGTRIDLLYERIHTMIDRVETLQLREANNQPSHTLRQN